MKLSLIIFVAASVSFVTLLLLPSLDWHFSADSKKSHKDNDNGSDNNNGVIAMFSIAANSEGAGQGKILNGINYWNTLGYIYPQQASTVQTIKVSKGQTIDNVRQSRLALLEGIDNAIQRLIKSEQNTLTEMPKGMFDTTYIAQLLKTDQLNTAIVELTNLKSQVIKVFGQEAANREVVPQIQNLISALKLQ
jgi:hypothetical protein